MYIKCQRISPETNPEARAGGRSLHYHSIHQLVKNSKAPDFNTFARRSIYWSIGMLEGGMRTHYLLYQFSSSATGYPLLVTYIWL